MKTRYFTGIVMLALYFGVVRIAKADDAPQPGVARISLIHGNVSTQRGDTGDWVATTLNAPVVQGDTVSTGDNSRGEVELDYANVLRMAGKTEARVAQLDHSHIQVQVAQGLVDYSVLRGASADAEVDTPNLAVHPDRPGVYRIQVNSQTETLVIVRDGEAQVSTPQGSTTVRKGQMITVEGEKNPQYEVAKAPGKDNWDHWNQDRNHTILAAMSWSHDNPYYTGTENLDAYGQWGPGPDGDWCWTPYVNSGWVPYRDGDWDWEPYYGWTWVSGEPWGWAPYHYGRWLYYNNAWAWWPGPVTPFYQPVWAPAYVSFFGMGAGEGFGMGFGMGFGFGSIGWMPLGPADPCFPWWGLGGGYGYNSMNITRINNIININNINNIRNYSHGSYMAPLARNRGPNYSNLHMAANNANVRRAFSSVGSRAFASGHMPRTMARISAAQFQRAQLVSGHVPVVPTRANLSPGNRPANRAGLPTRSLANQHFFATHQPPAGPRPFAQQQASLRQTLQNHNPMANANRAQAGGRVGTAGNFRRNPVGARPQSGRTFSAGPALNRNLRTAGSQGATRSASASPNWQKFGSRARNNQGMQRGAGNGAGTRNFSTGSGRAAAPSGTRTSGPNWSRFPSIRNPRAGNSAAPRYNSRAPSSGRQSFGSSGRGQAGPSRSGNWQRFGSRPAPSNVGRSSGFASSPRSSSSSPRWNSFPSVARGSRSGRGGGRSYGRPSLDIRKPIVAPRNSSGNGWGGSRGSYRSAPRSSGGGYSHSGGGGGFHGGGSHGGGRH